MGLIERFCPLLYVQISPERIVLENAAGERLVDEVPEVAVSSRRKSEIIAVGVQARASAGRSGAACVNPFAHPRTLMSDFAAAEHVMKHFVRRATGNRLWSMAPRLLMHPLGDPAGGFTQVELRAIRELGMAAGASKVYLWTGPPVSVEDRTSAAFLKQCEVV